jgi:hypothetical protein
MTVWLYGLSTTLAHPFFGHFLMHEIAQPPQSSARARNQNARQHFAVIEVAGKLKAVGLISSASKLIDSPSKFFYLAEGRNFRKEVRATQVSAHIIFFESCVKHRSGMVEFDQTEQLRMGQVRVTHEKFLSNERLSSAVALFKLNVRCLCRT